MTPNQITRTLLSIVLYFGLGMQAAIANIEEALAHIHDDHHYQLLLDYAKATERTRSEKVALQRAVRERLDIVTTLRDSAFRRSVDLMALATLIFGGLSWYYYKQIAFTHATNSFTQADSTELTRHINEHLQSRLPYKEISLTFCGLLASTTITVIGWLRNETYQEMHGDLQITRLTTLVSANY